MGTNTAAQSESSLQVASQVLNLLDIFNQLSIDCGLDLLGLSLPGSFGLLASLRFLGSDLRSILELILSEFNLSLEVSLIDIGGDSIEGDLGRSGDHVGWVDSFKRDSVDGIGAGYEEIA